LLAITSADVAPTFRPFKAALSLALYSGQHV